MGKTKTTHLTESCGMRLLMAMMPCQRMKTESQQSKQSSSSLSVSESESESLFAKQHTCFCQKQVGMDRNYDPSKLDMMVRQYIRSPDPLQMHGSNSDGVALGSKLTKPLQV